jgi:hypothetical protein
MVAFVKNPARREASCGPARQAAMEALQYLSGSSIIVKEI